MVTPPPSSAPADPGRPENGSPPLSSDERTMAMLCHLLGIFTGFVGALIIWLIKKDESAFVNEHGKEALNFQILLMIGFLIAGALAFVCIGFLLIAALLVANVVFCIMGAMAANRGEPYRYPMPLRLIK